MWRDQMNRVSRIGVILRFGTLNGRRSRIENDRFEKVRLTFYKAIGAFFETA
jgi:hypothetical protein